MRWLAFLVPALIVAGMAVAVWDSPRIRVARERRARRRAAKRAATPEK
jgi:hypothetical protein